MVLEKKIREEVKDAIGYDIEMLLNDRDLKNEVLDIIILDNPNGPDEVLDTEMVASIIDKQIRKITYKLLKVLS